MKTVSLFFAAVLVISACTKPLAKDGGPDVAIAAGPEAGDKIGESAAEIKAQQEKEAAQRAAAEQAAKDDAAARGLLLIGWEDMMPEGEEERLAEMYQSQMAALYGNPGNVAEGSAGDAMVQIGTFNTVKELNGKRVRLPGYTVPFEYGAGASITEFLLVPYFGACLHSPPPPPNQTLFVKTDKPIKLEDLAQAVWVEGTIKAETQESDLADAAYTLVLERIVTYEY